jgi:hypothetical protein
VFARKALEQKLLVQTFVGALPEKRRKALPFRAGI